MLSVRGSRAGRLAGKLNLMLFVYMLLHPTTACTDKSTCCIQCITTTAATTASTATASTATAGTATASTATAGTTTAATTAATTTALLTAAG
jgi:hypothetical protein